MEKLRLLLIILTMTFVSHCFAQGIVTTFDNGDILTCQVTVTGVKEKKAIEAAESSLRHALLFRGLADSNTCKTPLVGTDESVTRQHPQYFREMFVNNRFSSFITNVDFLNYTKKNKVSTISFTINIKALRLDLENQGIKRRFGL